MELIDDSGLADTGVSGDEDQLRPATGYNVVERSKKGIDLVSAPVQFLGNQKPVLRVVFAKREFVDAMLGFPVRQTASKITLHAGCCLVSLLSCLGKQLHDDCGD